MELNTMEKPIVVRPMFNWLENFMVSPPFKIGIHEYLEDCKSQQKSKSQQRQVSTG